MEATGQQSAAPIFVIGSPRSGTSILTWCLGQHPNILPLEESDWMGPFAVNLGTHYAAGSARGERSQLSAQGVERTEFFHRFGDTIDRLVLDHRRRLERNNHSIAQRDPGQVSPEFAVSRDRDEPKARWVDGTPEYSMYICGLHKLFPGAKFVHIARDVGEVVASLLNFRQDDGSPLVADAQQAYAYWLRTAQTCALAEQALGGQAVCRIRYTDLIQRSEATMRSVLEFLGETYAPACIEPLARRINSSRDDDLAKPVVVNDDSDVAVQAMRLSERLQQPWIAGEPVAEALAQFEADFDERVQFARELDANYQVAQDIVQRLQAELRNNNARMGKMVNWCGVLVVAQLLLASIVNLRDGAAWPNATRLLWLAAALFCAMVYAWLRRAGLYALLKRIPGVHKPA